MMTTSTDGQQPAEKLTDGAYGALRASAALRAGTSILITNEQGKVLVQKGGDSDTGCTYHIGPRGGCSPGAAELYALVRW
ncbi:hypothetical protein GCM10017667_53500 [Streptomyces filamentosus]|uniref:Uncharacterized protein n=1 Tax=Streptomyces filamentosus TaxID=67294 RepID=A0A919BUJ6_STRFL|nr:hypothetical protein GCM10017667_53500 [Streptomyces filamentosus]